MKNNIKIDYDDENNIDEEFINEEPKKKHIIRRIFFGLVLIIALIILYARYVGTTGLIIKEYSINTSIPKSFDGLKIAHFSDFHYGRTTNINSLKNLVKEINLTKPDIVLFTGDLVDKNTEYNKEIDNILIENLKNINAYYGKYYVNGDEDLLYKTFDTIMSNSNFISLDDTYEVIYNEKNETIFLSGISPDISLTNEIKENINLNTYNYKILLTHYPDSVTSVLKYNFDLIASGHSLNGQVRLPFIGSVYTKENSRKYYNSYYKIDNTNLYISSGIGNSTINIRLNNPPSFNLYRIVNR